MLLFVIEIVIAVFIHDKVIRPYIGDFLVVMFMYCFFKSFLNASVFKVGLFVLLFSFLIETLQYFNFITFLGWQHSKIARIVFGSSFAWLDLLAYTAGIAFIFRVEKWRAANKLG